MNCRVGWIIGVLFQLVVTTRSSAADDAAWATQRAETFRLVWHTVDDAYFDETFGGVNWRKVGEGYRDQLPTIANNEELRRLLQTMLGELGRTHFAILPREAAVFSPAERVRLGTTGVDVDAVEGAVVIVRVDAGSSAARAGLRLGTRIDRIDGIAIAPLAAELRAGRIEDARIGFYLRAIVGARLRGAVGAQVQLESTVLGGETQSTTLTLEAHEGAWSEPVGNYPATPLQCETRRSDDGIGYLRFNVFAPALMKPIRTFLRGLKPTDGLIIDLRGNPGGVSEMAAGLAGWLVERELSLGVMRLRRGTMSFGVYPQDGAFAGPVAILIDGRSASTSEILAAGLRDGGRARLLGERTAGAALPSLFRALPTGDLLQYAIADVRTPKGTMIEGVGVEPDEGVARTIADLAAARDTVVAAATAWLAREARQSYGRAGAKP